MKKISLLMTLCMVIICLFGCGNNAVLKSSEAKDAVVDAIEGVKAFDVDKMCKYFDMDEKDFENLTGKYLEFMNNTFGKLQYTIDDVEKIDEETMVVKATINSVDMTDVVDKAMGTVMSSLASFQGKSQEEVADFLVGCMLNSSNREDVKRIIKAIEITVNKNG